MVRKTTKKNIKPLIEKEYVLNGSLVPSGSIELSEFESGDLLDNRLIIQEMLDGTPIRISINNDGHIVVKSKNTQILDLPKYKLLKAWVQKHLSSLLISLGTSRTLVGQWMEYEHTIMYESLPNILLVTDIYDNMQDKYWCTSRVVEFCESLRITHCGIITEAPISFNDIEILMNAKSMYGAPYKKGLVLKYEDDFNIIKKASYIRPDFKFLDSNRKNHFRVKP